MPNAETNDEVALLPRPSYPEWLKVYGGPSDAFRVLRDRYVQSPCGCVTVERTVIPWVYVDLTHLNLKL